MDWYLDKDRPICPQICEQICVKIAAGEFAPGEKLLSVREVAVAACVNPNTVQKSFEELERQQLIYSVRGSGWFVRETTEAAKEMVERLKSEKTKQYMDAMQALGLSEKETKQYLEEWKK